MNFEDILSGDGQSTDLGIDTSTLVSPITDMLAPILWLSVAFSVLFIAFFILSIFRRRKLENALFDIQKILSEMNERDKTRSLPAPPRTQNISEKETVIAQADDPEVAS